MYWLSVIAGILYVLAFIPYLRAIRNGDTQPVKVTWLIWAVVDSIALVGMLLKHAPAGQMIGAVLGAWVVVVFAIKYGKPGWTWQDMVSLAGGIVGIASLAFFSDPLVGELISLGVILWAFSFYFDFLWYNYK